MKKTLNIIMVLFLCAGVFSCRDKNQGPIYRFSGTLELTEHGVGFPVPGRVAALYVDEGDPVEAGQLLGYLDRYALAKREHQRLVDLLAHGGTNRQAVEEAEQAMTDQEARSPVTGVVLTKVHETGEVVGSNSSLVIVGDRSSLWVRIFVPEGLVNRVQMGQSAQVQFDGLSEAFTGKVGFISPEAEFTPRNVQTPEERVTQTFAVKVYLDQPPKYLRPGVPADVFLDLP